MPSSSQKEAAALCMEHLVDHDWHGYTQGWGRWGDGEGTCPVSTPIGTCYVEQGDRDCSSAVISAYEAAGIDCGGATYTGNMKSCMLSTGNFRAHRMSDGYNCDDGYIAQRGDCYLNEVNHTAMCISAEPDMLAEFSIAENGTIYGQTGDSTGWESSRGAFYGFPWDWCMECISDGGGSPSPSPSTDGVRYRVSTDPNGSWWYDEMIDGYDTGGSTDNFAGDLSNPVRWLAVDGATYRVCTQASGWLPWVDSYNVNDLEYGCAGDGSPVVAIEVQDSDIAYQAHVPGAWYSEMHGQYDTGGSGDTFAGDKWNWIDGVAMRRI